MTCHFIALVVHPIVEREIRRQVASAELDDIPVHPEATGCSAPSARGSSPSATAPRDRRRRRAGPDIPPELTKLQQTVLELLGVPASTYR